MNDRIRVEPNPVIEGLNVEITAPDATSVVISHSKGTEEMTVPIENGVATVKLPPWIVGGATMYVIDPDDPDNVFEVSVANAN